MARVSVHLHSLCVLRTAWVYHLCDGSGGVLGLVVLVRVASGGFCETWTVVLRFFLVLNFLIMNTVVIANSDRVANAFFLFLLENNRHFDVSRGELLTIADYVVLDYGCLSSDTAVQDAISSAWFIFFGSLPEGMEWCNGVPTRVAELRTAWLSR